MYPKLQVWHELRESSLELVRGATKGDREVAYNKLFDSIWDRAMLARHPAQPLSNKVEKVVAVFDEDELEEEF